MLQQDESLLQAITAAQGDLTQTRAALKKKFSPPSTADTSEQTPADALAGTLDQTAATALKNAAEHLQLTKDIQTKNGEKLRATAANATASPTVRSRAAYEWSCLEIDGQGEVAQVKELLQEFFDKDLQAWNTELFGSLEAQPLPGSELLIDEAHKDKLRQRTTEKLLALKIAANQEAQTLKDIATAADPAAVKNQLQEMFPEVRIDDDFEDDAAKRLQQQAVERFLRSGQALDGLTQEQLQQITDATELQATLGAFRITCTATDDHALLRELQGRAHAQADDMREKKIRQSWVSSGHALNDEIIVAIKEGAITEEIFRQGAQKIPGENDPISPDRVKTYQHDSSGERLPQKFTLRSKTDPNKTLLSYERGHHSDGTPIAICRADSYDTAAHFLKGTNLQQITLKFNANHNPEEKAACLAAMIKVFGERNVYDETPKPAVVPVVLGDPSLSLFQGLPQGPYNAAARANTTTDNPDDDQSTAATSSVGQASSPGSSSR